MKLKRDLAAVLAAAAWLAAAVVPLHAAGSINRQHHAAATWTQPEGPFKPACRPFDLRRVRLLDGPFKEAMERDRRYLHELGNDRLLHNFRKNAGLPSAAEPLGGWEKRQLRGHTVGHYLSACAMMYASTGDDKLMQKAGELVAGLAACQRALKTGYLGAFPEEGLKKVIYGTGGWWAPWYTYHKIMAGMLDMHNYCGSAMALEIAEKMAGWAKKHLDAITAEQAQRMLEVEFGGMNEVLCNLYAVTKNPDHLELARRFDHEKIYEPLARLEDNLKGLHANTQIPKVIGAAREYELTADPRCRRIARFFWDQIANKRSYCTGGTSNDEHWRTDPNELAGELAFATQETCCTYNMLKLTKHVFSWSADARAADYYERALYNSILSTQDPETGMMMYFVPLASGYWKIYNTPYDSFWCCTGTGMENHARYPEAIYFFDDEGIYLNLFIASELCWPEKGLTIRQETRFPEEDRTELLFEAERPIEMNLRIRVAYWAAETPDVKVNGKKQRVRAGRGGYLSLKRTWKDGDRVEVTLPMRLHLCRMPDDENLAAVMYGPLVLAGDLGAGGIKPELTYAKVQKSLKHAEPVLAPALSGDMYDLESWIKPVPGEALAFRTANAGKPRDVTLVPFYRLFGRRYAIYWNFN
jgi:DUF1680 family protein